MPGSNLVQTKSYTVAAGATATTTAGAKSIDFLYRGTADNCTWRGSMVADGAVPIPLPPSVPYTLEYNDNGYAAVTVDNTTGDGVVEIVEKF